MGTGLLRFLHKGETVPSYLLNNLAEGFEVILPPVKKVALLR